MNINMIKVLAVVVIAGGLYWFMSGGEDVCAAHETSDACVADTDNNCGWNDAVVDDPTTDEDETAAAGCAATK